MARFTRGTVLLACGLAAPALAQTNVLNNPGFEQPGFDFATQNYRYLTGPGASLLTGWTCTFDNIGEPTYAYHRSRYGTFEGDYAIYLSDGDRMDGTANIQNGKNYRASFYAVSFGGAGIDFVIEPNGQSYHEYANGRPTGQMLFDREWRQFSFEFTGGGTNPVMPVYLFNTRDGTFFDGWAIDKVEILDCAWARPVEFSLITVCPGQPRTLNASFGGDGPFTYQWRLDGQPIAGADQPSYTIASVSSTNAGVYTCVATAACGTATAGPITIVAAPSCTADFDDGTGTGTKDCGVTVDDLIFYLGLFEQGDTRADLDNDQGVTIDDLVIFVEHFEGGC